MFNLYKLAWRNVWRHKRRTAITMSAVIFAVLLTGFGRSQQYGTYGKMEEGAASLYHGSMQAQAEGYKDNQTLQDSFDSDAVDMPGLLNKMPEAVSASPRITGYGLVSSDEESMGGMVVGVIPSLETKTTRFMGMASEGSTLEDGDSYSVLIGKSLAKNLKVATGDSIVIITQGYRNEMGAETYVVKGMLDTHNEELDRLLVVMTLPDAENLFSMWGRLTQVVIKTKEHRDTLADAPKAASAIGADGIEVLAWEELLPEMIQFRDLDNASGLIMFGILLLVVGFEIMNSTLMGIMERVKEFGILSAMGVKPRGIGALIVIEAGMKLFIALASGVFLAYLLISYLESNPIRLTGQTGEIMELFGFAPYLFFTAEAKVFLEPALAVALISVLSLLYPVYTAMRLKPVEALRRGEK